MKLSAIKNLIQQFEKGTLPKEKWTHEAHLIVAMWYLKHYTVAEATCLIRANIIEYNIAVNTPNTPTSGYHETITLFWIYLIAFFIKKHKSLSLIDLVKKFLSAKYAEKTIFFDYYTKELLFSTEARANWIAPDLKPLPIIK